MATTPISQSYKVTIRIVLILIGTIFSALRGRRYVQEEIIPSGLFVMTESNSKESVLDLIKPADPKLVEQIKQYLKSGKKESIPRNGIEAEDVDLSTLIISKDGKEMYKEIAELSLGKNGKVEITVNTISGVSAALEQLIKAGAHNLTLESASYQHWKDLL